LVRDYPRRATQLAAESRRIRGLVNDALEKARVVPAKTSDQRDLTARFVSMLILWRSALVEYEAGFRARDPKRLDAGSRLFSRASREARESRELARLLGLGPSSDPVLADLSRLVDGLSAFKAKQDRALELDVQFLDEYLDKAISLERAYATCVKARAAFTTVAGHWARLAQPLTAPVRAVRTKYSGAFAQLRNAYNDYCKAIERREQALLVRGDRKRTVGLQGLAAAAAAIAKLADRA
jgi:hypothetical protein